MNGMHQRLVLRLLEAGCKFTEEEQRILDDAGDLHQAATEALEEAQDEARPDGSRYSFDDDREFFRWLAEPKSEGGSGGGIGNSPLLDLALEFLEKRENVVESPCAGCGSAECACIPVGDEQVEAQDDEGPERAFFVTAVETWTVVADYKVRATSKQDAKDQVEEGHDYYEKEVITWDVTEWKEVKEEA